MNRASGERDIVLRADRVSKLYARRTQSMRDRLAGMAGRTMIGLRPRGVDAPGAHEFWALKDVSFELHRGEALGVIGLNGSGKTTLLRLLAGQIFPDAGQIEVFGTSAAMIDLQAGFQPGESGRSNIFLRSAALGVPRAVTQARADEIIEFSELGDAMDAPMATYSSGMKMRLAFSVMAIAEPDVLLIDEVLSVGDFRFAQKSLAKFREMRERSAFVFVSHSMTNIERFCDRAVVLNRGRVELIAPPEEAVRAYLNAQPKEKKSESANASRTKSANSLKTSGAAAATGALTLNLFDPEPFIDDSSLRNIGFEVNGEAPSDLELEFGEGIKIAFSADILRACRRLHCGVTILTEDGGGVFGAASDSQEKWLTSESPQSIRASVDLPNLFLNPGEYRLLFNMRDGLELMLRSPLMRFTVKRPPFNTWGIVTIPHSWRVECAEQAL